jgi:hypothetical protein
LVQISNGERKAAKWGANRLENELRATILKK